jgi:hypothetical protein
LAKSELVDPEKCGQVLGCGFADEHEEERWLCRLTFELSGPQGQGALPGRRRIALARLPGKVPCLGGSALERRVRRRCSPVARLSSRRGWELNSST